MGFFVPGPSIRAVRRTVPEGGAYVLAWGIPGRSIYVARGSGKYGILLSVTPSATNRRGITTEADWAIRCTVLTSAAMATKMCSQHPRRSTNLLGARTLTAMGTSDRSGSLIAPMLTSPRPYKHAFSEAPPPALRSALHFLFLSALSFRSSWLPNGG
jgi:hypothetical protein